MSPFRPHDPRVTAYTRLEASTSAPRARALGEIRRAVARVGGVLLDFQLSAGRSVRLTVELVPAALALLADALEACGIALAEGCRERVERGATTPAERRFVALVHVTFLLPEP